MSLKLHATKNPATAREMGVTPKEANMSTLATRPRTAISIRCMIQALMWMLTIPAAAPMISSTLAILHTFPSRPIDPKQTPNAKDTRRIITPRWRIFQTPANSAPRAHLRPVAMAVEPTSRPFHEW